MYMQQLERFIKNGKEHLVCKLNKGIYGLKQSSRVWYRTLRNKLEKTGFTPGSANSTIYFRFGDNSSIQLAGWYVADGLLAADSTESMDHMLKDIRGSFQIQDLGETKRLLGIRISRDRELGMIHISQLSFINMIAKRFNITSGRSVTSPLDLIIRAQDSHKRRQHCQPSIHIPHWRYKLLHNIYSPQHILRDEQVHAIHLPTHINALGSSQMDSPISTTHERIQHYVQTGRKRNRRIRPQPSRLHQCRLRWRH